MVVGLVSALVAAVLYGAASVAQAYAVRRLPDPADGRLRLVRAAVTNPLLVAVVLADLVGAGLHLVAIDRVPLYLAQAGIAAALPVTAVISARVLRERLSALDWAAIVATGVGIALLAVDSGEAGTTDGGNGFLVALVVLSAGVAAIGLVAYRSHGRFSGGLLSLLSGVGYSIVTLGARVLDTPLLTGRNVVLALVMALGGLLAFVLYSAALQRVPAASATAPLVFAETVFPTLVGVAVLGDAVGSGAWPQIVVGLLLAMAGAIWLAGFEGRTAARGEGSGSAAWMGR